jgi:hypothetical protein
MAVTTQPQPVPGAPNGGRNQVSMRGKWSDVTLSSLAIVLPMTIFSAVLLALIYHNLVQASIGDLQSPASHTDSDAFYVQVNATILVFIASWSSSVAPSLAGLVMILLSYSVAQRTMKLSASNQPEKLVTPFQLSILLGFLSGGGFGSFWSWLKYIFSWRHRRQKQVSSLRMAVSVWLLAIVLAYVGT